MYVDPFHEGEIAVQERAGEREIGRQRGKLFSARIVPGALPFLAQQRLLAVSAVGDDGNLWTSVWCGQPGFVLSSDGEHVLIRRSLMLPAAHDPVLRRLTAGREIGLLAIELATRRRLRINGVVDHLSSQDIGVRVRESFPNCPKYIHLREPHVDATTPDARPVRRGRTIDDDRRALLQRVDTAFVGSLHPTRGVDASHRGGPPGFIRVLDATSMRLPDYSGNSMFMTLGNFEVDPRASLAAIDFDRGLIASFSGVARLQFVGENPNQPTGGTGRYWDLNVREWVQFDLPPGIRWE